MATASGSSGASVDAGDQEAGLPAHNRPLLVVRAGWIAPDARVQCLLARTRPLWELWFLTGLNDGRVGVLFKLHHAVADGNAAVGIMGLLFDPEADAPDPVPARGRRRRFPAIVADHLAARTCL